jgi:hypothetical protein
MVSVSQRIGVEIDVQDGRLVFLNSDKQEITKEDYSSRVRAYIQSFADMPPGEEEDPTDWYLD